jgi:hypothetical protein
MRNIRDEVHCSVNVMIDHRSRAAIATPVISRRSNVFPSVLEPGILGDGQLLAVAER